MKFKLVKNLNEKWYQGEEFYEKIWWSDSASQFRNFIINAIDQDKSQAYRIIIGPDTYAIANGLDLCHDSMSNLLDQLYLPWGAEWYTLGIPTILDFDLGNYEIDHAYESYLDWLETEVDEFDALDSWFNHKIDINTLPKNLSRKDFTILLNKYDDRGKNVNSREHVVKFKGFQISVVNKSEEEFKQSEFYNIFKDLYEEWI